MTVEIVEIPYISTFVYFEAQVKALSILKQYNVIPLYRCRKVEKLLISI